MEVQHNKQIQGAGAHFLQPALNISKQLIDIILPPRCIFTGTVVALQGQISAESWGKLHFITAPHCSICGHPFAFKIQADMKCASCLREPPLFSRARSALVYDEFSRVLVLRFKHADQTHVLSSFLPWMMRAGEDMIAQSDIIIPVPLHRWRLLKRRYNQAAVIAREMAKRSGKEWSPDTLQRIRHTPTQGHLKLAERRKNVKDAFTVRDKVRIEGKRVLLVDDVYTTGATVNECTKILLSAGASDVSVLTLAKIVRD